MNDSPLYSSLSWLLFHHLYAGICKQGFFFLPEPLYTSNRYFVIISLWAPKWDIYFLSVLSSLHLLLLHCSSFRQPFILLYSSMLIPASEILIVISNQSISQGFVWDVFGTHQTHLLMIVCLNFPGFQYRTEMSCPYAERISSYIVSDKQLYFMQICKVGRECVP